MTGTGRAGAKSGSVIAPATPATAAMRSGGIPCASAQARRAGAILARLRSFISDGTSELRPEPVEEVLRDACAIAAGTLNNHAEGDDAPVVAARSRLDLGVGTLSNRDGALLFSAGELAIGGALDPADRATGRADAVLAALGLGDALARIERLGLIFATALDGTDTPG